MRGWRNRWPSTEAAGAQREVRAIIENALVALGSLLRSLDVDEACRVAGEPEVERSDAMPPGVRQPDAVEATPAPVPEPNVLTIMALVLGRSRCGAPTVISVSSKP